MKMPDLDDFLDFIKGLGLGVLIIGITAILIFVIGAMVSYINLYNTEKKIDMLQEKGLLTNEAIEALIEEVQL